MLCKVASKNNIGKIIKSSMLYQTRFFLGYMYAISASAALHSLSSSEIGSENSSASDSCQSCSSENEASGVNELIERWLDRDWANEAASAGSVQFLEMIDARCDLQKFEDERGAQSAQIAE